MNIYIEQIQATLDQLSKLVHVKTTKKGDLYKCVHVNAKGIYFTTFLNKNELLELKKLKGLK